LKSKEWASNGQSREEKKGRFDLKDGKRGLGASDWGEDYDLGGEDRSETGGLSVLQDEGCEPGSWGLYSITEYVPNMYVSGSMVQIILK